MKRLLAMAVVLGAAASARAWPWDAPQTPHPAVVRVFASERNSSSLGSGSLVAVNRTHGLVITNCHVVRDATGPITVAFPNGFRSGAMVLKVDQAWDLAALAIWRPDVQPIGLAVDPPRPGETLTIAGYGSGSYRAVAGKCVSYRSPGGNLAREWVEVSVAARLGDSGGPILNERGELAGVLWGASYRETIGSYCGRVRRFVASVSDDFQRLPGNPAMIARQSPAVQPAAPAAIATQPAPPALIAQPARPTAPSPSQPLLAGGQVAERAPGVPQVAGPAGPLPRVQGPAASAAPAASAISDRRPPQAATAPPLPPNRLDQLKTVLAAIGVFALLFHAIRFLGAGK